MPWASVGCTSSPVLKSSGMVRNQRVCHVCHHWMSERYSLWVRKYRHLFERLNPLREIKRGRVEKVIVYRRKNSCSARVIGIVLHCHHRAAIDLPRSLVGLCRNKPENKDSISVLELLLLVPSTRWWCDLARKYFPAVCFQCSPGLLGF